MKVAPSPQGALQRRAVAPTVRRIGERDALLPEAIRPLLEKLAERFCDPRYQLFKIRREAGATDWQVALVVKELGMTLGRSRDLCRVEVTRFLLRETSLTVAAIAPLVGFTNERGLRKLFRRLCGMTPAQARRQLRRVPREQRELGDEILSWSFRVRFHRGEVEPAELRAVLAYLAGRFGPV